MGFKMDLKALYRLSYGLYVVSSRMGNRFNGQIANTVFQITSEPITVAVSINKQNLTHDFIKESRVFTVSILSKNTPLKLIGHFGFRSGRNVDKFNGVNYKVGVTGAPIVLDSVIAYMEVEVIKEVDVGTHTVFIGKLANAETLIDGEPMTYAYYHQIKMGVTPKAAPTYIGETSSKIPKYKCTICGYIYDQEKGDPDSGVKPGVPFEELPEDWVCPVCGASKSQFKKIE